MLTAGFLIQGRKSKQRELDPDLGALLYEIFPPNLSASIRVHLWLILHFYPWPSSVFPSEADLAFSPWPSSDFPSVAHGD